MLSGTFSPQVSPEVVESAADIEGSVLDPCCGGGCLLYFGGEMDIEQSTS